MCKLHESWGYCHLIYLLLTSWCWWWMVMLSCEPQKIVNLNQKKEKEKGIVWLQEGYPHHAKSHHRIQTSPKWWKRMAKIEISISSLSKYYITFSSYNVSKTRSDFKKKKNLFLWHQHQVLEKISIQFFWSEGEENPHLMDVIITLQ